jgi:ABC-type antimicrobial peptide transport system ATPase subunit
MEVVGISDVKTILRVKCQVAATTNGYCPALLNKPRVVLADEPTGSLDSRTTDKVYELLKKINKTYGPRSLLSPMTGVSLKKLTASFNLKMGILKLISILDLRGT